MAEEPAFDDWQAEAQNISEDIQQIPLQTNTQTTTQQGQPQIIKEKPKPVDPKKVLQDKIKMYKQIDENSFETYFQGVKKQSTNVQVKISNQILKNDKDFSQFGKMVAKRFIKSAQDQEVDNLDENNLITFIDETFFLLYHQLQSKNLYLIKDKLNIAKAQRKKEEKQEKKKQEAEERRKREQKALDQKKEKQKKQQKKIQDDIFGGAALITSKQQEDERKNKQIKVVQVTKKEESEDDDFM